MAKIKIEPEAAAIRLVRVNERANRFDNYEPIKILSGPVGIDTLLRRAAICGPVGVRLEESIYRADLMDELADSIIQEVGLSKGAFRYLRNKLRPRRDR